jgi:hypothetical protein
MFSCLNFNGKKINNCLLSSIKGINFEPSEINENGFYFLGENPKAPFDKSKKFHIAFFYNQEWHYIKPNDGFLTFYFHDKKNYIYSTKKGWILI